MLTSRYSILRAAAGEGAPGGGDGDDPEQTNPDDGDSPDQTDELGPEQVAELKAKAEQAQKRLKEFERNNKRLTTEKKQLEDFKKRLDKVGLTADEIEEMVAERERAADEKAKQEGQIEQLLERERERRRNTETEWQKKFEDAVSARDQRIEELTLGHRLRDAIGKAGVRDELQDAAFLYHRQNVQKVEDPEEPDGFKWVGRYGETELSIEEYLKIWAENDPNAPAWLKPAVNTGAGAPGGANGRAPAKKRSQMTTAEKSKYIADHGLERFQKLPA